MQAQAAAIAALRAEVDALRRDAAGGGSGGGGANGGGDDGGAAAAGNGGTGGAAAAAAVGASTPAADPTTSSSSSSSSSSARVIVSSSGAPISSSTSTSTTTTSSSVTNSASASTSGRASASAAAAAASIAAGGSTAGGGVWGSAPAGYPAFTVEDFRRLPDRLILVRHAESLGNLDARRYAETPDYDVALSADGHRQAHACGARIRALLDAAYPEAAEDAAAADGGKGAGNGGAGGRRPRYRVHFVTSPYTRSRQTFVGLRQAFDERSVASITESVQLREQDFGNFQTEQIQRDIQVRYAVWCVRCVWCAV